MNRRTLVQHESWLQNTVERRFGVRVEHEDRDLMTASMSMDASRFLYPDNATRALGPVAFIVDGACGLVNHYNGRANSFAITGELSLELHIESAVSAHDITASARHVVSSDRMSLATCTLMADGVEIGVGSVRSVFVDGEPFPADRVPEWLNANSDTELMELLQLRDVQDELSEAFPGANVVQDPDPVLLNTRGIVHGAVVASALDVVANQALTSVDRVTDRPFATASIKVNYLRPMSLGGDSRYRASVVHAGRNSGVCDASAFDSTGRLSALARITSGR